MALITDYFGKASIDTDTSVATTVKTQRLTGVSVLEAYDLSKYAIDTPVFVITYKKTTDPVTGQVTITSLISWKALVNPGANTLTNLTVQPGYTDTGNAVGDFIECIPTSAWANSLIKGIRTSLNDDGTLKTSAVQAALNISSAIPPDWTPLSVTPSVTASRGQKENDLTYVGVDYTDRLQKGTKLRIPRTGTVPTQSMAFTAAGSQYATKASPAGITFTGSFTVEAWVYLNSYGLGQAAIISRDDNANNGWFLDMNGDTTGRVRIVWRNGGTAVSYVSTYQSLPLKTWVHVAATVVPSSTTVIIYFNGITVPTTVGASNASAVTQGTAPIQIGARTSTSPSFFDGYISEARIWSAAQTQAQIQNNMSISLIGTEANLVGLWQGNGNFNDKTANANNLTASGGATATQTANPFSAIEYGIVTNVTTLAGNTVATVFTGPCVMPNATLGATSYSTARAPYGFNTDKNKWVVESIFRVTVSTGTPTNNVWFALTAFIFIPSGAWKYGMKGLIATSSGANQVQSSWLALANTFPPSGASSQADAGGDFPIVRILSDTSTTNSHRYSDSYRDVTLTSQSAYTVYGLSDNGTTNAVLRGDQGTVRLYAECAYI